MTQIILVRHGQTPWNKDKIFRGSRDIPERPGPRGGPPGGRVAPRRDHPRGLRLAAVPGPRHRPRHCPASQSPVSDLAGLTDLGYGDWQGMPLTEVKVKYADLYRQWETAPATVRFPGGETLDEVRDRAMAAVETVVRRHPGQIVLLAAHRAVNKVLIAAFIGLDNSHFWRIGQDTTAINRFHRVGEAWHLMGLNDTCHLRGLTTGRVRGFLAGGWGDAG